MLNLSSHYSNQVSKRRKILYPYSKQTLENYHHKDTLLKARSRTQQITNLNCFNLKNLMRHIRVR